jgi:hypothetical protein
MNNPFANSKCIVEPHGSKISMIIQAMAHVGPLGTLPCKCNVVDHNIS